MAAAMLLTLKVLIAPALIGIASLIARRYGPAAGGVFAALPLTSGPVLLLLALERGPVFAAGAANGIVLAVAPLTVFAFVYARTANRFGWIGCSAAGAIAYLLGAWALAPLSLTPGVAFTVACGCLVVGWRLLPAVPRATFTTASSTWDISLRMLLAAVLVLAITAIAGRLGPRASGLLTPFPIAATILAAGTHRVGGGDAAVQVLRGLLAGLFSFAVFFLIVAVAIERYGIAGAFSVAAVGALLVQIAGYLGHPKSVALHRPPSIGKRRATLSGWPKSKSSRKV